MSLELELELELELVAHHEIRTVPRADRADALVSRHLLEGYLVQPPSGKQGQHLCFAGSMPWGLSHPGHECQKRLESLALAMSTNDAADSAATLQYRAPCR